MAPSPPPPPPEQQQQQQQQLDAFTQAANHQLAELRRQHDAHLAAGVDHLVCATQHAADVVRRAAVVHRAVCDIVALPPPRDDHVLAARRYLQGLLHRLQIALTQRDVPALALLTDAARCVLDDLMVDGKGVFDAVPLLLPPPPPLPPPPQPQLRSVRIGSGRRAQQAAAAAWQHDDHVIPPSAEEARPRGAAFAAAAKPSLFQWSFDQSDAPGAASRSCCGLGCSDLSNKDRAVLWLYVLMVLGAVAAVAAVTAQFVQQALSPASFIRSSQSDRLPAPVVTVCLSQRGVPFSRLQMFKFIDSEQRLYAGTNPGLAFAQQNIDQFKSVVERFWDNPNGEDCDGKVGDHFPFPLRSLNDIASGAASTRCRQCYRVGNRHSAVVSDTSFEKSAVLDMYTDNYFLQCIKSQAGLDDAGTEFLQQMIVDNGEEMEQLGIVSVVNGSVSDLRDDDVEKISWQQACNIFYFAYFPKKLKRVDESVDIRYEYNGTQWRPKGNGPYFEPKVEPNLLPEESLQMFVSTNSTTRDGQLGRQHDMILIGADTQTFATFRPIVVYGTDRYDISSSTSGLRSEGVTPLFGFWLRYKIFYNYNRFVVDEYYRESTYPAGQWVVDLTGYATLFTGASVFSLLLLPLLRAVRRRERARLLRRRPEVYVWSQARPLSHPTRERV